MTLDSCSCICLFCCSILAFCSSSARSLAVSSTGPPSPPTGSLEERGEVDPAMAISTSTGRGGGRLLLLLLCLMGLAEGREDISTSCDRRESLRGLSTTGMMSFGLKLSDVGNTEARSRWSSEGLVCRDVDNEP